LLLSTLDNGRSPSSSPLSSSSSSLTSTLNKHSIFTLQSHLCQLPPSSQGSSAPASCSFKTAVPGSFAPSQPRLTRALPLTVSLPSSQFCSSQPAIMSEPLTKVDSAVQGLSSSPPQEKGHMRKSSSIPGVYNIAELGMFPSHHAGSPDALLWSSRI
jgi:hypothetical protein